MIWGMMDRNDARMYKKIVFNPNWELEFRMKTLVECIGVVEHGWQKMDAENFLDVLEYHGFDVSIDAFKMAFMDVSSGKFRMEILLKDSKQLIEDMVFVWLMDKNDSKVREFVSGYKDALDEYGYIFEMLDYSLSEKYFKLRERVVQEGKEWMIF